MEATPRARWRQAVRVASGAALITVLMLGARVGGWPPAGALLPGGYRAGGFERSVDAYGVAAANWERDWLGPGNRVGGDLTSVNLGSTYGRQSPVREVASLFYSTQWSLADDELVQSLGLQYLVVDRRLAGRLPEGGAYFADDPHAGQLGQPLTDEQLGKLDGVGGVDRVYDNGAVRIYRMGG